MVALKHLLNLKSIFFLDEIQTVVTMRTRCNRAGEGIVARNGVKVNEPDVGKPAAVWGSRMVVATAVLLFLLCSSRMLSQIRTTANLVLGNEFLFPKRLNVTLSLSEDSIFFDFIDDERYLKNIHMSISQIDSIHNILGAYSLFYLNNKKTPLKFGITRESETLKGVSFKLGNSEHRQKRHLTKNTGNAAIVLFPIHAFIAIPTTIAGNMQFISDSTFAFTPAEYASDFTMSIYFNAHQVLMVRSRPFKILTIVSERGEKYNFRVKDKCVRGRILRMNERYDM